MTPAEFTRIYEKLGLKPAQLAPMIGVSVTRAETTVSEWRHGKKNISGPVARLLWIYDKGHRPSDWPA